MLMPWEDSSDYFPVILYEDAAKTYSAKRKFKKKIDKKKRKKSTVNLCWFQSLLNFRC